MKRFIFTICTLILSTFFVAGQNKDASQKPLEYQKRIDEFKSKPIGANKIVFLGNSLTENGKWDVYFPETKPVNRGISGDNTAGMLARIDEIANAKPSKLFIMAGVNDIAQNQPNETIVKNIETIIKKVGSKSAGTHFYMQSVLPVNNADFDRYPLLKGKESQIDDLNKRLQKMCKDLGINFINISPTLTSKKRRLDPKYTNDGLHLNAHGYAIWVAQIRPYVK